LKDSDNAMCHFDYVLPLPLPLELARWGEFRIGKWG
jgi:hypothetical protein